MYDVELAVLNKGALMSINVIVDDIKNLPYVKEELTKLKVSSFSLTLISGTEVKDLNEALIKNKDSLMKNYKYVNDNLKIIISKREEERNSEIEL